ncbi:MAG: SIMPL domain-containing protein [Bacteroidales bacterium]|nr:SIMPL domain-containing protein [Bacteroidales bacterium]
MKTNLNPILFSVAIIIAAIVIGNAYVKKAKVERTISVTGLGKKDFTSDLIVWEGNYSKENMDLKVASAELEKDKKVIDEYLLKNGINKKDIVFSAVGINKKTKKKYSDDGRFIGEDFEGYILFQSIQISSREVEKVETISRKITELINQGIQFYSEPPRYYLTKLADLKIELISKATEDARARAEKISEKSGGNIGGLVSAQMGIFQITGQNSDEEYSWGGTFNTSSKEKSASITMKLTYKIE